MANLIKREVALGEVKEVRLNDLSGELKFIFADGPALFMTREVFEQFFRYDGELPGQEHVELVHGDGTLPGDAEVLPNVKRGVFSKKTDNKSVDSKGD